MKPKVYLIHGWAYDVARWHPFMQELKGQGVAAKLLHVPGLTTEPLTRAWTIDDYVEWLDRETGAGPAVLIGHSNGGWIALNYAVRFPNKVSKLILIDSSGIRTTGLKARLKRSIFKAAAKAGKLITSSPQARRWLYRLARERDYHDADPVMRQTMSNIFDSYKNFDFSRVKAPTLLIWGRQDQATPLKNGLMMHRRIDGSKLEVVDEARHSPHFTHPVEVAAMIARELNNERV